MRQNDKIYFEILDFDLYKTEQDSISIAKQKPVLLLLLT